MKLIPILLMLQYTISARHRRVKMEESVVITSVDTCAPARMIIMDTIVIVSIILLCILKLYLHNRQTIKVVNMLMDLNKANSTSCCIHVYYK